MSTRKQLVEQLKPLLPKIKIIDVPRTLDAVEARKPVIQIYRERRAKARNSMGDYQDTFALWIIAPGADVNRVETDLDTLLDEVTLAIDAISWIAWTSAERSVYGDQQQHAYRIDLTVYANKE